MKSADPTRGWNGEAENREALWKGIADGVISMVVSDHSPCTPQLKKLDAGADQGSFMAAWQCSGERPMCLRVEALTAAAAK